ncbi:uncharacterized protein J3R85_006728 [Psidium guajava]|nr:uncharacterized protein J3R85_006728 [Psidium guajava]
MIRPTGYLLKFLCSPHCFDFLILRIHELPDEPSNFFPRHHVPNAFLLKLQPILHNQLGVQDLAPVNGEGEHGEANEDGLRGQVPPTL